jgi:hypothetical protein
LRELNTNGDNELTTDKVEMRDIIDFYYNLYLPALSFWKLKYDNDESAIGIVHNVVMRACCIRTDQNSCDGIGDKSFSLPALFHCKVLSSGDEIQRFRFSSSEQQSEITLRYLTESSQIDTRERDFKAKAILLLTKISSVLPSDQFDDFLVVLDGM